MAYAHKNVVFYYGPHGHHHANSHVSAVLQDLEQRGIVIGLVVLPQGSPLHSELAAKYSVLSLPAWLVRSRRHIEEQILSRAGELQRLQQVLTESGALVGLVYYGSYWPGVLANTLPLGFLNYHPCPLPQLRGFECDSFAILKGFRSLSASVHQLSDAYDEGVLLAKSPEVELDAYSNPGEILPKMDRYATELFALALERCQKGECTPLSGDKQPFLASRAALHPYSWISPSTQTLAQLWRVFRTFATQNLGIRLKMRTASGDSHWVDDLVLLARGAHRPARLDAELELCQCLDGWVGLGLGTDIPDTDCAQEGEPLILLDRLALQQRDKIGMGDSWWL